MTMKSALITDSFQVVKKTRKTKNTAKKEERSHSPQQDEEVKPAVLTAREKELQTLQQFDLDWRFGPCTGISRLQRWERAAVHGLNPPEEIRDLLLREESDREYTQCLWRDYPL